MPAGCMAVEAHHVLTRDEYHSDGKRRRHVERPVAVHRSHSIGAKANRVEPFLLG